jgi:integrase
VPAATFLVVALRVKRLDLLRGRCEVVESATEVGSVPVWEVTTTDERRSVRLPRFLIELLAEYLASPPHGPEGLVVTAPQGGPLRQRKFLHGQLKPAARRAGLPETLRAHDLRHTAASRSSGGCQRKGGAALPRPQFRGDDLGPLRPPMARRA